MNRSNDISQGTVCQVFMLLRYVVAQNSLANKFNKKAFSRMHTARLPTISCCIPFPGVRVGMHSPGHTHPEVPCLEEDRYPRHIHSPRKEPGTRDTHPSPERTWDQRYPPPTPVDSQTPVKNITFLQLRLRAVKIYKLRENCA